MKVVNKSQLILEYLENGNTLTQLEATKRFGTTRLGSIIHGLRKLYNIETNIIKVLDKWGNTCRVAEYKYLGIK